MTSEERREINSKIEHHVATFVFAWCATPQSEDRYVAQTALANEIRKTLNLAELDRFIRILKA